MGESTNFGRREKHPAAWLPGISKHTADLLLRQPRPADLIAVYCFYLYTANWQCTNRPKATTRYCGKGLKISEVRVRLAKEQLRKLDLIEDYVDRDAKGRIKCWYIHLKYIRSSPPQSVDLPHTGDAKGLADGQPNASSASKGNALGDLKVDALSAKQGNALSTPNPLSGGAAVLDSVKDLASMLLSCLKQESQATAYSIRETRINPSGNSPDCRSV